MKARILLSVASTVIAFAVAAASVPLPPPEFPRTATTSPADAADRYSALIEQFQPTQGRDAGGPNAWSQLIDAVTIMREVDRRVWRHKSGPNANPDYALLYDPPETLTDQDKTNLELSLKLIAEYQAAGVFDKLALTTTTPRAVRPRIDSPEYRNNQVVAGGAEAGEAWDGRLISILLPELGATRALARLNAGVMARAAAAKDAPRYLGAFEQSLATARISAHQPGLIDRLVADAVTALMALQATKAIKAGWYDRELLTGLSAAIDRQTKWPSLDLQLEGERLLALDACRWAFDEHGMPNLHEVSSLSSMNSREFNFTKLSGPIDTRDETVKAFNEYYDKLNSASEPTADRRKKVVAELDAFLGALPGGQLVVPLLAPAAKSILETEARTLSRLTVLRVTIAIELHKLDHGQYPATLAEIDRTVNVCDPWTGESLGYSRTATGYELTSGVEVPARR